MSNEPKDLEVIFSPQVEEQMAENPAIAEALRSFIAAMRQAHHAVETGQHASMEDAMEAITGHRPKRVVDALLEDPDV